MIGIFGPQGLHYIRSSLYLFSNFLLLKRVSREPMIQKEEISKYFEIFVIFSSTKHTGIKGEIIYDYLLLSQAHGPSAPKVKLPQISECAYVCISADPASSYLIYPVVWLTVGAPLQMSQPPASTQSCRDFFSGSSHTSDLKIGTPGLPCHAPGVIGSALGLVGPVSVYCDWVR